MTKLTDILLGINQILKKKFPEITIDSRDLKEEFSRPSFRTEIDNLRFSHLTTKFCKKDFTLKIYYFPKSYEINKLEILETKEMLSEILFLNFKAKNGVLFPIDELNFEIIDGVLLASFETYSFEEIIDDSGEMMEKLELGGM